MFVFFPNLIGQFLINYFLVYCNETGVVVVGVIIDSNNK